MSYTPNSKIDTSIADREREMLLAGFSYFEIAQALGTRQKSVSERNRIIYRVDIRAAFEQRILRDGIPCRLNVSDAFGFWFSGFFDGEGHLGAFSRVRADGYPERRLIAQIQLRDDDTDAITHIKDNLGVGTVYTGKANGASNPKIGFRVEQIKDLAEIVVPLFDRYPLYTKKRHELIIWREMVRRQYVATLGGYSQRTAVDDVYAATFDDGVKAISNIRTYRSRTEHSLHSLD